MQKTIQEVKAGDKVRCIRMTDDPRPVPTGFIGTVKNIDDIGTIHVVWQDGRLLGLVPGVDQFEII